MPLEDGSTIFEHNVCTEKIAEGEIKWVRVAESCRCTTKRTTHICHLIYSRKANQVRSVLGTHST